MDILVFFKLCKRLFSFVDVFLFWLIRQKHVHPMLFAVVHLGVDCIRVVIARQDVPLVLFFFFLCVFALLLVFISCSKGVKQKEKKTHTKRNGLVFCVFFFKLIFCMSRPTMSTVTKPFDYYIPTGGNVFSFFSFIRRR